ncbi:alginate export family protein [Aliidiomarina indica]|uniref:alginate export family protein n=1 Tax=Aliidiomarina indica TaxID=2749147 RepID=UPI001890A8D8|nr:alginate export family protein [Aliidiomarina indica]
MLNQVIKNKALVLFASIPVMLFASPQVYGNSEVVTDPNKIAIDFRYRLEHVDQANPLKNALASTLRTRVNAQRTLHPRVSMVLEVDHVEVLGDKSYNSTVNQRTHYSVVADPRGTDINQAYLRVKMPDQAATLDVGRIRMNQLNQRFLGGVGWRQNEQTFDGLRWQQKFSDWSADIAYIQNVNRIFGPKGPAANERGTLFAGVLQWQVTEHHELRGFIYDFDFNDWHVRDSRTLGVDYQSKWLLASRQVQVQATLARQEDAHQQPQSFSHNYHRFSISAPISEDIKLAIGSERLAGDGVSALQTPLATLHAFQGFTDLFLVTPNDGIRDHFVTLSLPIGKLPISVGYHQFKADTDRRSYGNEWNLTASYRFANGVHVLGKFADYSAKQHAVDTQKAWLMVSYAL